MRIFIIKKQNITIMVTLLNKAEADAKFKISIELISQIGEALEKHPLGSCQDLNFQIELPPILHEVWSSIHSAYSDWWIKSVWGGLQLVCMYYEDQEWFFYFQDDAARVGYGQIIVYPPAADKRIAKVHFNSFEAWVLKRRYTKSKN